MPPSTSSRCLGLFHIPGGRNVSFYYISWGGHKTSKDETFTQCCLMLGQRLQRWPIVKPALCLLFTGRRHMCVIVAWRLGDINPAFMAFLLLPAPPFLANSARKNCSGCRQMAPADGSHVHRENGEFSGSRKRSPDVCKCWPCVMPTLCDQGCVCIAFPPHTKR